MIKNKECINFPFFFTPVLYKRFKMLLFSIHMNYEHLFYLSLQSVDPCDLNCDDADSGGVFVYFSLQNSFNSVLRQFNMWRPDNDTQQWSEDASGWSGYSWSH